MSRFARGVEGDKRLSMRECAGEGRAIAESLAVRTKQNANTENTVVSAAVWHTLARVTRAKSEACARIP